MHWFCFLFCFSLFAISLFTAGVVHTQKISNPSLKQPDDVSLLQGEKSEVFAQYSVGAGNIFESRSSGVHVRNIFSLCIDSCWRTVAQRGNLAPAAAEAQSLVGLAWCSQCYSSNPTVDPWALWGWTYINLFSLPVQMELERWIIHVFERPLLLMKNVES